MTDFLSLRKVPLVRILIPFILGIIIGQLIYTFVYENIVCILFINICLVLFLILSNRVFLLNRIYDISLWLLLFTISLTHTSLRLDVPKSYNKNKLSHTGIVCASPKLKSNSSLIILSLQNTGSLLYGSKKKLHLYSNPDSSIANKYKIGDKLSFDEKIYDIKNNGNPNEFDYKHYMKIRSVFYQVYVPDSLIINHGNTGKFRIKRMATNIKARTTKQFEKYRFQEETKALVYALLLGNKEFISDELHTSFKNAGAIHILAVSGLHIGIIYLLLSFVLSFMNNSKSLRFAKFIILILCIWFYAIITGLSPSVSRAALLFTLVLVGKILNRGISFFNILSGAAIIMLMANPLLLFDVSFQLSFTATGAIVYFHPIFSKWFSTSNLILNNIYKLFTVSIAAQIGTAPLTIYYFNQFPTYFWLTNIFIIPLVFCILIGALVYLVFSWVPLIYEMLGWILNINVRLANGCVNFIEGLPGAIIENLDTDKSTVILVYIFIFLILAWLLHKRTSLVPGIIVVIMCVMIISARKVISNAKSLFVVYNSYRTSAIGLYSDSQNMLIIDNSYSNNMSGYEYAVKNHWMKLGITKKVEIINREILIPDIKLQNSFYVDSIPYIVFGQKSILFYRSHFNNLKSIDEIYSDYLIVCKNEFPPDGELKVKMILLDSSNSYNKLSWEKYALKYNIELYDIKKEGAFQTEM